MLDRWIVPGKAITTALTLLLIPFLGIRRQVIDVDIAFHFVHVFDVPLVALTALTLVEIVRTRRVGREAAAFAVFCGLYGVALLVNPTLIGLELFLRILMAGALAYQVATLRGADARLIVLLVLVATVAAQVALGVAQVLNGAPLGVWWIGEFQEGLVGYGRGRSPRGTMTDAFALSALALVTAAALARHLLGGRASSPWSVLVGVLMIPVGLSFSRTALVALAGICAGLLPGALRRSPERWMLVAILAGAAVPAVLASEGWTGSLGRGLATDRGLLAVQAAAITADAPLLGVGPGRYLVELTARPELHVTRRLESVHSVPLLVAADAGIPAAAALTLVIVLLADRAARAGPRTLALAAAFLPWLVLDAFPYMNPQGSLTCAAWAGLLLQRPMGDAGDPRSARS